MLFGLSYWQLQRGLEKQHIKELRADSADVLIDAAPVNWQAYHFRDVTLEGEWSGQNAFLLENRVKEGQVGFEVLTPFRLAKDQTMLLVNRGWVSDTEKANDKPAIGHARIRGVIYQPEKGVTLGNAILPDQLSSAIFPKRSVYIDMELFADVLDYPLESTMLVLDDADPVAYPRLWKAAAMPAEKHFGYAIQWLGLGVTLLVYGVIWFRRQA